MRKDNFSSLLSLTIVKFFLGSGLVNEDTIPSKVTLRGRPNMEMVRPERFELPAFWFVARRSIQLS